MVKKIENKASDERKNLLKEHSRHPEGEPSGQNSNILSDKINNIYYWILFHRIV